ncbi:4Fe-4S dicluster domain-containing protein [Moorella sulfitireducens]|uniref:4Fe-4S dicluster domain-containing protein n=1 Tax=Neomoorella sulfitireducens TaxID=2972948 RepID=UPI003BF5155C
MGIKKINTALCKGCGKCDNSCPMDVIYFDIKSQLPQILYPQDCQSCFLCIINCPSKAIEVTAEREQKMPMPY